ncbi:hypothetical protein GCM10010873_36900 [Cypionkella aquatica]|uniref:DUF2125 domain-containing protein n=1 Tax=Cypionkella aquatica TaxID=1756042 RepID=A0AA37X677_9RHOB|nr:DUF2125 domain-containing protein [Cypionkella aquatica]GLS88716.1 hypothetical protein GCM10010873_36900 [Cypionkella aquatica]
MKHWKLASSTAAIAILAGTGAFADVTPEEVWQNWQDMSTSAGQTVTSVSAERDGDTLVVSGVAITYEKDGTAFTSNIEQIDFTDNGDGTVDVTTSDATTMTLKAPAVEGVDGGKPTDLKITLTQPEMVVTASGTVDALSYEFEAPTLSLKVEPATAGGEADGSFTADVTQLSGSYLVEGEAAAKTITSDFTAAKVALTGVGKDTSTKTDVNFSATIADLAGSSNGTFLGAAEMADLGKALKDGFAVNGSFSHGAMTFALDVMEDTKPTKIAGTSEAGDISFAMDATHLQYGGTGKALAVTIASADIPFPELKVGYQEAAFNMAIPVGKTDAPADFALLTKLVGFTVSDEVWGMVDPAGNLPHDPATVIIDTKGKVTLTTDLFDEAAMAALGEAPPGELNALDVTELKASVAGAELTGAGAFTFDNTDKTTFPGMPLPTGKLDLKLTGGNTLLDKLVAMGLLPQDQAMGFKMMVSMFANSAADKDEMTSTLEFKDKGFYANGQKLQ